MNKQSRTSEVFTGIFVVAVISLLIFFTVIISGVDLMYGRQKVSRTVFFENVGSLRSQDPVVARGMVVGSVVSLQLADGGVHVTFVVDPQVEFREGYLIRVASASVLGGSKLELFEGTPNASVLPEEIVLKGEPPHDLMLDLSALVAELKLAVDGSMLKETFKNLHETTEAFAVVSKRLERGEGTLGKLLSADETIYNDFKNVANSLASGKGTLGKLINEDTLHTELKEITSNFRTISASLVSGKGTLGKLLTEDELHTDLKGAVASIRVIAERLANGDGTLGKLLTKDSSLVADLEIAAGSLKNVMVKLEKGEGSLGKLLNDPTMANEVEGAIKDVRQIIDNMRDTAPITSFTSIFFGGM